MKKFGRETGILVAAIAALTVAAASPAMAQEIVIGLNMVKSGALKNVGEATETSVDIAVAEINAAKRRRRQKDKSCQIRYRQRSEAGRYRYPEIRGRRQSARHHRSVLVG